jgi:nucleoside-diphosphate-sugar epimerase
MKSISILGANGFVGSSICEDVINIKKYTRNNHLSLVSEDIDTLVVASVSAMKWKANLEPEEDLRKILEHFEFLKSLTFNKLVLISTIDVFPQGIDFDEDSPLEDFIPEPYGKNRALLEMKVLENFNDVHIIRLPGLFGKNLKKNILFDLRIGHNLRDIQLESKFQYLEVNQTWNFIAKAIGENIKLLNVASEPVTLEEIIRIGFNTSADSRILITNSDKSQRTDYRMTSKYCKEKYFFTKDYILNRINTWAKEQSSDFQ